MATVAGGAVRRASDDTDIRSSASGRGMKPLEKGVFLDVVLPRAREPREVRFNHLVREALELWVLHRRSRIRGNGSSALFLWDYDARLRSHE
ncbi:MAG TPA: hypothetical protein VF516_09025 [Kofleriaceae bacterium]